MNYLLLIFLIFSILLINYFLIKKNYLPSMSGDIHQKFTLSNSIPLSGGIYLIIIFFIYSYNQIGLLFLFIISIFLIGLLSDIKIIYSVKLRIFLQSIVVIVLVIFFDLKILSTRIGLLDKVLEFNYINYLFVTFCILIIINGTNFIDGLNTLVIGYYLIITIMIFNLELFSTISVDNNLIILGIIFLSFIYILNLLNKLFLGDSGAYLLGFSYAILLINIFDKNGNVSPFFILLLLWYPGFEILFSIIRKNNNKNSPFLPDTNHLHQIIFLYLKKNCNIKSIYLNTTTGMIINFYNFVCISIATHFYSHTQAQILIIIFNIIVYIILYRKLLHEKLKNFKAS